MTTTMADRWQGGTTPAVVPGTPQTVLGQWWDDLGNVALGGSVHWQLLVALVLGALGYWVFRFVVIGALARVAHRTDNDVDDRLLQFVRKISGLVFFFLIGIWVARIYGWDISPLLAGAGIAGIAIGFAAKEILADILAGVSLIADQPFRIGDRIKIEHIGKEWGGWGDVVDLGLRRTSIRNTDGVIVNYPNSILSNSVITNFSFENQPVRVRVRFLVAFDADVDTVGEVCATAIRKADKVLPDTVEVLVRSLWDVNRGHATSGVLMEGRYRIADVRNRTKVRSEVFRHLLRDFAGASIELALPRFQLEKRD